MRALAPASLAALVRERREIVALGVLVLAVLTISGGLPPLGIASLGLVAGSTLALHALGLILVFRANRVVNIAQVAFGAVAGVLFAHLSTWRTPLVALHSVCPTCLGPSSKSVVIAGGRIQDVDGISSSQLAALSTSGWLVTASWVVSVVIALAAGALFGYLSYWLVVHWFREAPRLVLMLATAGLAEVATFTAGQIPGLFGPGIEVRRGAPIPFTWRLSVGGVQLGSGELLRVLVTVTVVTLVVVYLRRSVTGLVTRGIADSPTRAATLGVPVGRVNSRVWLVVGLVSSAVAVLQAATIGADFGTAYATLVRAMTAASFGGFVSIPVGVVAAFVVGVFDQATLRTFTSPLVTDGALFLIIAGVLLALRAKAGRADQDPAFNASREIRPIPAELRDLPPVVLARRRLIIGIAVIAVALPLVLSPSQTNDASVTVAYGIIGLSLLILTGWAGQVSLGQVGLAAVGAWVNAVLGWPFPFGFLAGAVAAGLVAALIGLPALRLRGLYLGVVTLAFGVAVPAILLNPTYLAKSLPANIRRPVLLGLDLADPRTFFYVCLGFLLLATLSVIGLKRSSVARELIAARDNEAAAQSFGINLLRARLMVFALSGFLAGVAGVIISWATFGVNASSFGPEQSVRAFLYLIIGGVGTVAGPLLGTVWLAVSTNVVPSLAALGPGGGAILILLFLPGGVSQGLGRVRDAFLRRVADRYKVDVPSLIADKAPDDGDDRAPIKPLGGGGVAAIQSGRRITVAIPVRYRLDDNWVEDGARRPIGAKGGLRRDDQ